MAKIPTKRAPKYKTPRVKRPPPDPPLPTYRPMTPGQIDETAIAQATSQVQPTLDELSGEGRAESGQHLARSQDLTSWYQWAADQAAKSSASTSSALTGLQSAVGTGDQQSQDVLAAALRGDSSSIPGVPQSDQGAIGGVSQDPQVLAAAAASAGANRTGLAGLSASQMGLLGQYQNLIPTELISAQGDEARRHEGVNTDITGRQREASSQIGTLAKAARSDLVGQDMDRQVAVGQLGEQRANRLFQQYMSEKQFGLQAQNLSFQQWLSEQGLNLDVQQATETHRANVANETETNRANVANETINSAQVTADAAKTQAEIDSAKTQAQKDQATARGKRHTNGVQALTSYLAPTKDEVNKNGQVRSTYHQRVSYDQAIRTLYGVGIGPMEARQIIMTVINPKFQKGWAERAKREINNIKLRRRGFPGNPTTGPNKLPHLTPGPNVYG